MIARRHRGQLEQAARVPAAVDVASVRFGQRFGHDLATQQVAAGHARPHVLGAGHALLGLGQQRGVETAQARRLVVGHGARGQAPGAPHGFRDHVDFVDVSVDHRAARQGFDGIALKAQHALAGVDQLDQFDAG